MFRWRRYAVVLNGLPNASRLSEVLQETPVEKPPELEIHFQRLMHCFQLSRQ